MLGLIGGGAGVGVLPADVHQLPHPGVVFVKMRKPKMELVSSAVWSGERETPEVVELVELLKASWKG